MEAANSNVARKALTLSEAELLQRIAFNPAIFGGKPIIRGRRLAVEHLLGILGGYPWLERMDILACLAYAKRQVGNERIEPLTLTTDLAP